MEQAILLYDSDCGFCRWSISKILAWDRDRRLRPVALTSSEADELLPGMDHERKMASWHLVTEGRVYSGGGAVPPLTRFLPAGAPIAALAEAAPHVTDKAYRWVAGRRGWLSRALGERVCAVEPSGPRTRGTAPSSKGRPPLG